MFTKLKQLGSPGLFSHRKSEVFFPATGVALSWPLQKDKKKKKISVISTLASLFKPGKVKYLLQV